MLPQFWTLRSAVKQAYGVEARAAAKEGRASVQKPTDKTVEGSARHELPAGPLPGSYERTAGKDRHLTTADRASHGSLYLPGLKTGVCRGESDEHQQNYRH